MEHSEDGWDSDWLMRGHRLANENLDAEMGFDKFLLQAL